MTLYLRPETISTSERQIMFPFTTDKSPIFRVGARFGPKESPLDQLVDLVVAATRNNFVHFFSAAAPCWSQRNSAAMEWACSPPPTSPLHEILKQHDSRRIPQRSSSSAMDVEDDEIIPCRPKRFFSQMEQSNRDDEPMWVDEESTTDQESDNKRRKIDLHSAEDPALLLPAAPSVLGFHPEIRYSSKIRGSGSQKRPFCELGDGDSPGAMPFDCPEPSKRTKYNPPLHATDPQDEETLSMPPPKQYLLRVRPDIRPSLKTLFCCFFFF
jgi:hypothetical protein